MSDKFKYNDDDFKYFIGYKEGKILKSLCIISPQMIGSIKYFENGGKKMFFVTKMMMGWINIIKFGTKLKKS